MDTEAAARGWIDGWLRAWPEHDVEAIGRLYADDASYRSHPFRETETARAYVTRAFAEEEFVEARFGRPLVASDVAAIEYWAILRDLKGAEMTLAGMVRLRFGPDGRAREHREYWHLEEGRFEPPPGWGV